MKSLNRHAPRPRAPARWRRATLAGVLASLATLAGAVAGHDPITMPAALSQAALKSSLTGIAMQGNTALAVGARGTILASADAGATWKQAPAPVSVDLTSVRITGPGSAWALGHDGVVLRSDDQGATWRKVFDGQSLMALLNTHYTGLANRGDAGATAMLKEIAQAAAQSATPGVLPYPFLDIRIDAGGEGFLAGAFGLLLHTRDGGASWEPWMERAANDRRMHLYAVEQGVDGVFYLAGEQGLLRRHDRAAARFVALDSPYAGTFFGLKASENGLVAFGLRGNAFASADQGTTWQRIALGTQSTVVDALACAPGELALVTQAGQVFLSRGGSVTEGGPARGGDVAGAAFAGPGQVALVGSAGARLARVPGCGADSARIGKN
ncbi:WD40/YVTN/BNR-like repeat-containing protein [Pseudoduganella umbonata]|uniref:Photosystem II stability/assembly factor-like uncharacterized protein n=1 Tax=Pseudoduganella umbonata TaxID=864828 RepID=A0A4V1ED59_9BURK|nr:YCF48-related protein [Pseudoduganella umbonata]MBB3219927.1 photosystem II stability/assembly factor-like uncharacterized protein [Pseudoduganella umbonata]QCP09941.1 hypothetical protein FCL38_05545 [Pseudoduganella umbonata]